MEGLTLDVVAQANKKRKKEEEEEEDEKEKNAQSDLVSLALSKKENEEKDKKSKSDLVSLALSKKIEEAKVIELVNVGLTTKKVEGEEERQDCVKEQKYMLRKKKADIKGISPTIQANPKVPKPKVKPQKKAKKKVLLVVNPKKTFCYSKNSYQSFMRKNEYLPDALMHVLLENLLQMIPCANKFQQYHYQGSKNTLQIH